MRECDDIPGMINFMCLALGNDGRTQFSVRGFFVTKASHKKRRQTPNTKTEVKGDTNVADY